MTKRRVHLEPRRFWTADEDAKIRALYPDMPTVKVAAAIGRTLSSTYQRAKTLRIAKSAAYLASPAAGRTNGRQGMGTRFKKGHAPANKGVRGRRGWAPGRMKEGQFKKGERRGVAAKPIGTERVSRDGYLERKVNNDLPLQRRWRAVHLLVWESANGPLPKGHAIAFINGNKADIRLENLQLVTRAELMRRNTLHRYPKEIARAIQLVGALNRKINRRTREEQDRRPA